jgi:hypothetical protein
MELRIVNPKPKFGKATLIEPAPFGYIHVAAAVEPPARGPLPGRSEAKSALLARLKTLAGELERLDEVEKVTVYQGILLPPTSGYAKQIATHPARYDVVVLIETSSPETIAQVQSAETYKQLTDAVSEAAKDMHVMTATCLRRIGDVDKTRPGLFLFNYFVADDPKVALELWEQLGGWYEAETGLDNSTLLAPTGKADYIFVNHARWDSSLAAFTVRQTAKPSFFNYVLANLKANHTGAMPLLYHLA